MFLYICHGRKSSLVEFQILLVESPIEISTSTKSNWSFYQGKPKNDSIIFIEGPLFVFQLDFLSSFIEFLQR